VLSARALLLAGLIVIVGIVATWLATPPLEVFWRLALLAGLVAIVVDGVLAARYRARGRVLDFRPLPLGREVRLRIALEITPPGATSLTVRTTLAHGLQSPDGLRTFDRPDTEPSTLEISVCAVSLGRLRRVQLPCRVLGPLGLTWWRTQIPLDTDLLVVPEPATRAALGVLATAQGIQSRGDIGYGVDLHQLRPYRSGDPRRSIDWKASARSNALITREMLVEHRQEVMLLIDAGRSSRAMLDSLPRLGHCVNMASRVIQLAAQADDHVGLVAFAGEPLLVCPPMRAATAGARLQRELSLLKSHAADSNPLLAALRLQTLVRHRTLVIVMTELDDPSVATQLTTALRLITQRHLVLVIDFDSAAVSALETAEPANWLDPYVALAAQEFRQAQRANALRLTRFGCRVQVFHPAYAEEGLARAYRSIRAERRL